ncbi:MAG: cobyrinate a,c-diamide synthase [Rhizomicrobium sp.]
MSDTAICRAAMISAPASGQGKTTVTAALARHFADRGERITVFKTGPDFLDPKLLERACGTPVYQLDLFMGGEAHCRSLLFAAAQRSDVVLIEGVMGLYDGAPSSADLAARFGVPIFAVIDASAMAGTFGAIVHGLATYRSDVKFAGAIANRVGSERHAEMLRSATCPGRPLVAYLPRLAEISMPERHLGLVQAEEIAALDSRIARAATEIGARLRGEIPIVEFEADAAEDEPEPLLRGCRVAIARDAAFSFLYAANLELLRRMGAQLAFFSPLNGDNLPSCDALYLPGDYPELHLEELQKHTSLKDAIRDHYHDGKPILAECGGLLYLLEDLVDANGSSGSFVGLLKGRARMQSCLAALALQSVKLPEGTLRGHTFHHSVAEIAESPIAGGVCPNNTQTSERVYRKGRLTASYIHFYFPSNPKAAARLFQA